MLIDEQYITSDMVLNMKNYSLKDGDRIMIVGYHNVYTIGNTFTTDESGKCIVDVNGDKAWSNEFVLVNRINKNNYWHYYYSNSHMFKLLRDYREINNNSINICKEEQVQGIKNRLENIIEYGLMEYMSYIYTGKQGLYYNHNYSRYKKECEELNISRYYYHNRINNILIQFNSEEECDEYIINRKVD